MRHLYRASVVVAAVAAASLGAAFIGVALADGYKAADRVVRPAPASTEVLPERFLRGYDPVTVTFTSDMVNGPGPGDDVSSFAQLKPAWPGAWT